jgi:hypothetical protein
MKKLAAAAVVSLMVSGCAHAPLMKQPQVNRAAKADKLVVKKAEAVTPNQVVKKRWFPKFRVQWLHK